ncbi:MAG: 4-hydroxythreonine-4-phosphate dehydrogenase PdxA [Candidatus Melainabacteria bacterium GWF2_37_15]|nr:MAG: 4-hydroxythreonine-4-phosphate dehydrogenase PdxA [Candidatus Melainabacteria bacterium GWF2_37_15]
MTTTKKILITLGDVGGIGPEIVLKALNFFDPGNVVVVGSSEVFYKTAYELDLPVPKNFEIIDIPFDFSKLKPGEPTPENGKHSMLSLIKCCELAKDDIARAIVTAPVSKKSINMAGYNFSGQTEVLKKLLKPKNAEMLFVAGDLRVLLLTRHVKLAEVSHSLKTEKILASIITLVQSLENDFNIKNPKIALCALNPHAGEDGIFGLEEEYFLTPAVKQLVEKYSINVEGPFPSDTLWAKAAKASFNGEKLPYDAYVACYHDQGLIPVKMLAMDTAVNMTINLPVIRTSPSHGTAYDIAGKNIADFQSMVEAIKLADSISTVKIC